MTLLDKVSGRDDERRSRLHSRRGAVVVDGLIPAILGRRRPPTEPWMAPRAVRTLHTVLHSNMTLLELGSGVSTAWYAKRVSEVTSIEPAHEWAGHTRKLTHSLPNVTLIEQSVHEFLATASDYDVIVVDHLHEDAQSRVDSMAFARDHSSIVVLDDSDRPSYAAVDALMSGWRVERYTGFRPRPFQPTETAIWYRGR